MKTIKITSAITQDEPEALKELCEFLGMPKDSIESEMYYFTNGEGFNYNGFTTSLGSETETVIRDGDYIISVGGEFKLVTSDLAFLVVDSIAANKMESFLDEIYQSGTLDGDMDERYREFFNLNNY